MRAIIVYEMIPESTKMFLFDCKEAGDRSMLLRLHGNIWNSVDADDEAHEWFQKKIDEKGATEIFNSDKRTGILDLKELQADCIIHTGFFL